MDEVTPWIKDYFLHLATIYGSHFDTVPPTEKVKRCQLKKVLTPVPKDYYWVVLSDKEHEVQGRISKEVAEQCLNDARRDAKFVRHAGSLIEIRHFSPLFVRVEDGPSPSAPRKVLALDIKKAKLRGAAGEPTWGSPQSLDSVLNLKEWVRELRKPDGNRDLLKIRKNQKDEAGATKQLIESPEPLPDPWRPLQPAKHVPATAQRKAAYATLPGPELLLMQSYCRKWKKAVPGLNEFAHSIKIPPDVRSKLLEKQKIKEAKAKPQPSGMVPTNGPRNMRGALEIGSSPARLSSVPRATTPEEWAASPSVLKRLYNDRETEMSSDVYSSRQSSPVNAYQDIEMGEIRLQTEPETVPETPQIPPDSQTQHLSPPPPAQLPRPRSSLPSSNPQVQNHLTSPSSVHTSIQAVSGSQLPKIPPVLDRSGDVPSNGPTFVLPWTQRDEPLVAVPKSAPESHPSPEKLATKPPTPIKVPSQFGASKPQEKKATVKEVPHNLAFGKFVAQALENAFQPGSQEEAAAALCNPPTVLPAPKLTITQLPPPEPRSKPPPKVTQKSLSGPSASNRLTGAEQLESPARQPLQALNRKVPVPEVGPTREPVRGRNANGAVTMVLIPASDDTKLSSSSKQNSSSQSVPSSLPVLPSTHHKPSQLGPSSEPQLQHPASQPDISIAHKGDCVVVQVNESVADIETSHNRSGNTQSSLEYASTQEEGRVAVCAGPQDSASKPTEVVVVTEEAAAQTLESPLPRIVAICGAESPQSVIEEVDELESDSEKGDHPPAAKRKLKPVTSNPSVKATEHLQSSEATKPDPPSKRPSKPAPRPDSIVERVPSPSSSKLPPMPFVVIERKRGLTIPTDEKTPPAQKRRFSSSSSEGFPVLQPTKRSKVGGYNSPAKMTLPRTSRTPLPAEESDIGSHISKGIDVALKENHAVRKPAISDVSRSAKGKGRAEGIKGLENISTSADAGRQLETVQVYAKKKVPDTGSKRKPSDAFSAQDDSRDAKRPKVAKEPEPRKLGKQLSFVDPNELKRPFRSKPQIHKTPYSKETAATTTTNIVEPDNDGRTSKYFNPQIYRGPEYPRLMTTPEAGQLQKVVRSDEVVHENGRDFGDIRSRIDSRKASKSDMDHRLPGKGQNTSRVPDDDEPSGRSAAHTRVQKQKQVKGTERDLVPTQSQYPPTRKLGSFAPDLNPPPLPGLPGGRLTNRRLREILIRTGKVRTRETKAAESNHTGR